MRPTSRTAATIALAGATLLLAALPWLNLPSGYAAIPALRFLGRLHLVALHFPVVLVLVAFVVALRAAEFPLVRRLLPEVPRPLCTATVAFAALSAALSALAGWLLAQSGSHDRELLQLHLWTGSGVAAAAMLAWTLQISVAPESAGRRMLDRFAVVALTAAALLLGPAGHAGAGLTHGEDFLSAYAPDWLKPLVGPRVKKPAAAAPPANAPSPGNSPSPSALVFRDHVHPILERHCLSCHGENKVKGGLRLDSREAILRGGKNPPAVVAGDPKGSLLLQRLHLPLDADEHMPPDDPDRAQPTAAEIALLEWWVGAGLPGSVPESEIVVPHPGASTAPAP